MSPTFSGFPEETFKFLRDLGQTNTREWFQAHRQEYDEFYVGLAKQLVEALGPELKKISANIHYEPKVNGSIFRINRDVRFSSDKSPYKTHIDLWFWEGPDRGSENPGFFMRISDSPLMLGAGMHQFSKEQLPKYRAAVIDEKSGQALDRQIQRIREAGDYEIGGATRKTVPRGFDEQHPRASLLLHEGLYASWQGPVPDAARTEKFVDYCCDRFRIFAPLSGWIVEHVLTSHHP